MKKKSGEVDALPDVALYYIEKEGITNLRVAGETGYYTRLSFATRRDWPELNAIMDKALSQIPQSKKDEILRKWIHLEGTSIFKNKVFWLILTAFVGGCGLIILAVVIWNKSLRRIVSQRTAELSIELAERKQAEAKLKKSEAMMESIFQASPLGVGLVKNGRMQWHNETMSRMLNRNTVRRLPLPRTSQNGKRQRRKGRISKFSSSRLRRWRPSAVWQGGSPMILIIC